MGALAELRGRLLVALTDEQPSTGSTVAIGGAADLVALRSVGRTVENDPEPT